MRETEVGPTTDQTGTRISLSVDSVRSRRPLETRPLTGNAPEKVILFIRISGILSGIAVTLPFLGTETTSIKEV